METSRNIKCADNSQKKVIGALRCLPAAGQENVVRTPEPLLPPVNRANAILTQASARYLQKQAPRPAQEKRQQIEVQQEKV